MSDPLRSGKRVLDPIERLSEILFGLIMTLTFTLGAGLTIQEEGREGARQLLIATIGCNIAWGVIDGVFYVREAARRSFASLYGFLGELFG